jgi:hypothetical protein
LGSKGIIASAFAYAINAVFICKNFIFALAQVNLWVPDLSDVPVAQSLNKFVGHASVANQIGFAGREGLHSELSPYDIRN